MTFKWQTQRSADDLPQTGAQLTVDGATYTVRHVDEVYGWNRFLGYRVHYDFNGVRVYGGMKLSEWRGLVKRAAKEKGQP